MKWENLNGNAVDVDGYMIQLKRNMKKNTIDLKIFTKIIPVKDVGLPRINLSK